MFPPAVGLESARPSQGPWPGPRLTEPLSMLQQASRMTQIDRQDWLEGTIDCNCHRPMSLSKILMFKNKYQLALYRYLGGVITLSHLCPCPCCRNPAHLVFEAGEDSLARNNCGGLVARLVCEGVDESSESRLASCYHQPSQTWSLHLRATRRQ
ncbi:hypothetical protein F5B20DRAFT_81050 [Whalleya microplaca]|nr:hypothetical protein F5B20DRAFT_81050 [Whalleya microplaca]